MNLCSTPWVVNTDLPIVPYGIFCRIQKDIFDCNPQRTEQVDGYNIKQYYKSDDGLSSNCIEKLLLLGQDTLLMGTNEGCACMI